MTTGNVVALSDWTSPPFYAPSASDTMSNSASSMKSKRQVSSNNAINNSNNSNSNNNNNNNNNGAVNANGNSPTPEYNVVPYTEADPISAGGTQLITSPVDTVVSPLGWHDIGDGQGSVSSTLGNNVAAQSNLNATKNPFDNSQVTPNNFVFNFQPQNNVPVLQSQSNIDFAVTNMFYMVNVMHDLFYRYGFDEQSGNFQVRLN